jgi:outer membrane protein assembly factor BamD
VECYLSLGLIDEAQTAAAVLGHNYQSSEYYNDTYILLGKRGLGPKAKNENWLVKLYRKVLNGG